MTEFPKIAIIGLGYVGLPLALEFAKKYPVIGFDLDEQRVIELKNGLDHTQEADLELLNTVCSYKNQSFGLTFSSTLSDISRSNIYIVTVPTPINQLKQPNLEPLLSASKMLGTVLKKDDIVIYESTVYPGCTEEDCVYTGKNIRIKI